MSRDFQRQKVYEAELAWRRQGGRGIQFWVGKDGDYRAIEAEMQKYVSKVMGWKWTHKTFPRAPLGIRIGEPSRNQVRGYARRNGYYGAVITMPRGAKGLHAHNEGYLLHEIAHCLSNDYHGPEFCRAFLALVKRTQGQESHDLLLQELRARKVRR